VLLWPNGFTCLLSINLPQTTNDNLATVPSHKALNHLAKTEFVCVWIKNEKRDIRVKKKNKKKIVASEWVSEKDNLIFWVNDAHQQYPAHKIPLMLIHSRICWRVKTIVYGYVYENVMDDPFSVSTFSTIIRMDEKIKKKNFQLSISPPATRAIISQFYFF
jgi:hypothetical protein